MDSLRKNKPRLQLANPLDLPCTVARNYIQERYSALRLSKNAVIVNAISRIESKPAPLTTIYLYGPDLLGEKEAILGSGYFMSFPQRWKNGDEECWTSEHLGLNREKTQQLLNKYVRCDWIHDVVKMTNELPTNEVVKLTYDFALERGEPNGSTRTIELEAFSQTAINTICRNFSRGRANSLFPDGPMEAPQGKVEISEIDNDLKRSQFPDLGCFKIGPSNNLLTYHAIYFLNLLGRKANIRTISCLLAAHYLRATVTLRNERKRLKKMSPSWRKRVMKERMRSQEERTEKLKRAAFKNVRKSVRSLLKQDALDEIGSTYQATGSLVETPFGEVTLDPHKYRELYSTTLGTISKIHELTARHCT